MGGREEEHTSISRKQVFLLTGDSSQLLVQFISLILEKQHQTLHVSVQFLQLQGQVLS